MLRKCQLKTLTGGPINNLIFLIIVINEADAISNRFHTKLSSAESLNCIYAVLKCV